MVERFPLNVNDQQHEVEAGPDMPLLYALRNDLGLNNPKFGCGLGQCGACTVHIDGAPVGFHANVRRWQRQGRDPRGLGTPDMPHPVQAAYVQERVPQFGYCMSGWIMTAAALRNENKKPSDEQIKEALTGNAGLQVGGRLRRADAMRERCMDRLRFATG